MEQEGIEICICCGELEPRPLDSQVFERLGQLTVIDERLHHREVPTITVQELMEASQVAEERGL